jgi:hypothetical protein
VCRWESGQDGALPLLRNAASTLPFHSSTRGIGGRPGSDPSSGHHPQSFPSPVVCQQSCLVGGSR